MPTPPPIMQRRPMLMLPEIPTQPAMAVCAPIVHVVAHLDLIVQFNPILHHRIINGAPVDGGVGADLHVVADPGRCPPAAP